MDPKFSHSNPHFLYLCLTTYILILSPSHIFDPQRFPYVSKLRNSNNTSNLSLKPVAAKMLLNYLMTGGICGLIQKTPDLGNESYELSIVLCTFLSVPQFQNNATKYSGSTLHSSWLRYKIV